MIFFIDLIDKIIFFKKSVEKCPKNENWKFQLKQLQHNQKLSGKATVPGDWHRQQKQFYKHS